MDTLQFLLTALANAPADELAWLALADGLEELRNATPGHSQAAAEPLEILLS